ncbi:MAG: tRNA lysidine(34) synthetase TilS [Saprospiraceae bacterium]
MLDKFLSYIEEVLSVSKSDKFLLAVSGGIDSMVMADLFRRSGFDFGIAHINHSTRNGSSDKDMVFVAQYCSKHLITLHSKTLDYTKLSKGNFQKNARDARYKFFNSVLETNNYSLICTAHHKEDRWETFLMNINRKSGIKGLISLKAKEKNILRPLLCFEKAQIVAYASTNDVKYVHDISNDEDEYLRNFIRHNITPTIASRMDGFINNSSETIRHLESYQIMTSELIASAGIFILDDFGYKTINLNIIKNYSSASILLHSILDKEGFDISTVNDILSTNQTGACFLSKTHECLYNRGELICRPITIPIQIQIEIPQPGSFQLKDGRILTIAKSNNATAFSIDSKNIKWPITIRSIANGDKMTPQAMNGKTKSIKKICTDQKINRFVKEKLLVAISDNKIVMLIGHTATFTENKKDDLGYTISIK